MTCVAAGYVDGTDDPAEHIARLWPARGEALFADLRGDFACALWDRHRRRGVVVRDQLGGQPLHYHLAGGRLIFGSEVRDVVELLGRRPGVDRIALAHWVAMRDVREGRTFYDGVRALLPGQLIALAPGAVELRRYWRPVYRTPERVDRADAVDAIRSRLTRAVQRTSAGVASGVMMSGGLDSTAVAALLARHAPDPRAYSGVFPETPTVDESDLIRGCAEALGIRSASVPIRPGSLLAGAAMFPLEWQVPLRPQNMYLWRPLVLRAAADGTRALHDGEGGDLLFSAPRELVADRLRRGRPLGAVRAARALPGVREHGATRYVLREHGLRAALPPGLHEHLRRRRSALPPWVAAADRDALAAMDPETAWKRIDGPRWWARRVDALTAGLQAVGIRDHTRRRAAMAGLAARSPFFDVDMVELTLSLPPELSLDARWTRPLQRDAMRDWVPDAVRLRPGKSYFDELFQRCLAVEDLAAVRSMLSDPRAEIAAFVELGSVRRDLVDHHPARHPRGVRHWVNAVWRLVTAECWLRAQAAGSVPATAAVAPAPERMVAAP